MLEQTVPCKDRVEKAFERKLAKYVSDCSRGDSRARCYPVGCKGFAVRSPSLATAIHETTNADHREPQDGCGSKEENHEGLPAIWPQAEV